MFALLLAIVTLLWSCSSIKRSRLWRAGIYALLSLSLFMASANGLLSSLNIHNYQRLINETELAQISFKRLAPQHFLVDIRLADSAAINQFEVSGDEWQLSARFIKWKPPLTLLGVDNLYQLDRLQGRYREIEQERLAPRSVYSLGSQSSLDLWTISRKLVGYLPWLDAFYGSAVYLPMQDKARFSISAGLGGLLARPLNPEASEALENWQ